MDDAFYPFSRERKCEIIAYRLSQKGHYMPFFHSHNYYEFIFIMSEGKIVKKGTVAEIFAEPAYLNELSIQLPTMTQFIYELNQKGFQIDMSINQLDDLIAAIEAQMTSR